MSWLHRRGAGHVSPTGEQPVSGHVLNSPLGLREHGGLGGGLSGGVIAACSSGIGIRGLIGSGSRL